MRILLTGSKGQLGTEVERLLADSHHEVIGVDLDNGERTLDITRRDLVLAALAETTPDAVIHGAAFTAVDACEDDPDTAFRVNSLATRFIAEGARRVGAHVVYVSTDYVFDGTKPDPYVEWDRPSPVSMYGRSKLGGELELDPGSTIARTSWVCSAHGSNMVKTVLRLAGELDELAFVDDQFGHPTFASDLAEKVVQLAVERAAGVFHVTNQGAVSWFEFVRAILEAGGHDPSMVRSIATADLDPPRPAPRPANGVLDNFALRETGLGELRHFTEPLAEVVAELGRG
jgi:dTDP-4-dehydrorhamnose reductase